MPAAARSAQDIPEQIAPIKAPFPMPKLVRPSFPDHTVDIRNITGYGALYAIEIRGLPESSIENVHFQNVELTAQECLVITDAMGLAFNKFQVRRHKP